MAKSLDDLVDFLLDEIALDSGQGASLQDVVRYTRNFYAQPYNSASPPPSLITLHPATTRIDRSFISQVWQWLTTHEDLRIGRNNEYRDSSLAQIETDFPDALADLSSTLDEADSINNLTSDSNSKSSKSVNSQRRDLGPRIYANQDRIYQAICGHEADSSRVSELEFALLCTIGAARHDGILQGELGRLTKQDKRSVPKRTDLLQAKGYIEKHSAYNQGHKTSRIILRRFADTQPISNTLNASPRLGDLALQILTVMKEKPFTTQEDLASRLSISDPWKLQVLNQVVQYLVRRGSLKRVKTAFAPDSVSSDLRLTLQYIQALEIFDYENTDDSIINLNTSLDTAIALVKQGVEDGDDDAVEIDLEIASSECLSSQPSARPSWNPDRALPNAVYDLATLGGDDGITNMAVRQQITGVGVRRPAEALLVRLSHASLKSRPSVGQDLALVRTTEVKNGVHRFVHRTLDNYHDMVNRGDLTWSATSGGSEYAKHLDAHSARSSSLSGLDTFGFATSSRFGQQMKPTRFTTEDIASIPGSDAAVIVRPGEATLTKDEAGVTMLSTMPESVQNKSSRRSNTPGRPSYIVTLKLNPGFTIRQSTPITGQNSTPMKPKSKPRTFLRGTHKFWSQMFRLKKLEIDPASVITKQSILMTDHDCLEMFASRPRDFDSLLVRALKQDLPIPHDPTGINDAWVDKTRSFLDRTHSGVFYMPSGLVDSQQERWSCKLIIKSNRLGELDITSHSRRTSVHFLSSSAAHTYRLHRIPQGHFDGEEETPIDTTSLIHTSRPLDQAISTATAVQEPQEDYPSRVKLHSASPPKNTLIVTLVYPKPDSQPVSRLNVQNKILSTSIPHEMSALQHERTQRQRRPTKKALESAQTVASEVSTPESPSSSAATPQDLYILPGGIQKSTTPSNIDHIPLAGLAQRGTERDLADNDQIFRVDVAKPTTSSIHRSIVQDSGPLDSSTTEDLQLSEADARGTFQTHAGNAHTVIPSPEQADPVNTSIVSFNVENNDRVLDNGTFQPTNLDTIPSRVAETGISNVATTEVSKSPMPASRDETPENGSSQLAFLTGRDAIPYYRKFLMELVYMCGGVVPNDPSLLKRAMGPKSIEAHVEANMNIKLIKTSINALAQSGKLKVMQFAFQRNGFNHTKSILALPSTQPTDPLFISLQTKISLLPTSIDYVPPELESEATRKPQGVLRTADSPAPDLKATSKPVATGRPKRQRKDLEPEVRGEGAEVTRERIALEGSMNTGFLTLKVPRIAEIKTDKLFASKYFDLPAQPVIVDTSHNGTGAETAFPATSTLRRNAARNSRRFSTATRKVQWRTPKYTPLPKSLRAILANDHRVDQIDHTLSINPSLESFDRDIDFVATWEQKNFDDLQEPKPQEWNFINHLSFRKDFIDTRGEGDLQFHLVIFNRLHEDAEEVALPEPESWNVFAEILSKEATKSRKANENKAKRKRTAQEQIDNDQSDDEADENSDFMSSDGGQPKRKRQRGPNHKWRRKPRIAGTELDRRRQKRNFVKPRGVGLRDIPKAWAHRITTAIVVVRVLAGGLDKYLDWKLVARLIPGEPESVLQSRWRTISTRYNNDFDAMVHDLQAKYLDALADDKVPSVDYNDLYGSNWEGIFEWAIANINADNKGGTVIELPPDRDEFLELVTAEVGEITSVRPLHNNSLQYTQATKEDFWCSMIAGTTPNYLPPVQPKAIEPVFQTEEDETDIQLARARSWVLAAVMTPHQAFNAELTHRKLRKLAVNERECEELIDATLGKLQNDKIVVTKDSADAVIQAAGTTLSGTYHWKLSTKFVDRFELNRHITSKMLKQAVKYKIEVLDPTFARGEVITIPGDPYLDDGVMVAIFNLMNAGMMLLEPGDDMSANRYGIDGGTEGYKTRSMDKRHLYFSVVLRPTPSYTNGDLAITEKHQVDIPRGEIDRVDGTGLIPLWFDINHDFRPDIWDMVVGAVTGLISCRPGVSSLELVRTLQYAISQRDMAMIVQYLFECKFIEKTRSGWETTEVWWFAIGTGTVMGTGNGAGGSL